MNNRLNDSDDASLPYDEKYENTDRAVFIISFVPIKLWANNAIVWINERPSSTRYCRSIKFEFIKESATHTLNKYKFYNEEIGKLATTHVTIEDNVLSHVQP